VRYRTVPTPMASIWDALGRPSSTAPMPRATASALAEARRSLRRALHAIGGVGAWRSPAALRAAVRGDGLPVGRTWEQLWDGVTLQHVQETELRGTAGIAMRTATWNVRCILDPHTTVAAAKRALILRLLGEGCLVLLQETHWTEAACATWGGCFPMVEVRASAARPGPNGGLCGGVAVIVPPRYRIVPDRMISPGCCLQVTCVERSGGPPVTFRSLYLPPLARRAVLEEIRRCDHPQTELIAGGDVNMCVAGPRDDAEAEEAQELLEWAAEHGAFCPAPHRADAPRPIRLHAVGLGGRSDPGALGMGRAAPVVRWPLRPRLRDSFADRGTGIHRAALQPGVAGTAAGGSVCGPQAPVQLGARVRAPGGARAARGRRATMPPRAAERRRGVPRRRRPRGHS
jgi:hypothetical protein